MKRSFSHSFKGKKGCCHNKNLYRAQSNFGFQTVWKFRNAQQSNSQICQTDHKKSIRNSNISQTSKYSEGTTHRSEIANNQKKQIKQYIRNMKNDNRQKPSLNSQTNKDDGNRRKSQSKVSSKCLIEFQNKPSNILEVYQKRIQELIQLKLSKKSSKMFCFNNNVQDQLQIELKQILNSIKNLQSPSQQQQEEIPENEISQIQKKILIFEKLIAESLTQSQLLKKYYYSKRILKKPTKYLRNSYIKADTGLKNLTFTSSFVQNPSIHFETTNQVSYKKPQKICYKQNNSKTKNIHCSFKQVVPRSVYQQQYLNYGGLPVYNYKQSGNYISTKSNNNQKQSVYHADFKQITCKVAETSNLDCKRDKIKTKDIWFFGSSSNINNKVHKYTKQNKSKQNFKLQRQSKKDDTDFLLGTKSMWNKQNSFIGLKMQSQKQGEFSQKKVTIDNLIKDKSLINLKYSYKKQAQA